jgi:Flp pilus assembly protein TadD
LVTDGVGFKLVERWDRSRPYRASHAPDGTVGQLAIRAPATDRHLVSGRHRRSATNGETTFARNPEHRMFNVWTLNRIVAEFTARGDYETAEAFATFALDRYSDKVVLHVTRGRARYLANDDAGALASFDAALKLDAGNREATLLKARLLDRRGRR